MLVETDTHSTNPLDQILGDKWISNDSIRKNNFENLIGLPKSVLLAKSKLYSVTKVNDEVFLMRQNKSYSEARNFDLLLQIRNDSVCTFKAIEDFSIIDIKKDNSDWILLLSDWDNTSADWESKQQIEIKKIDKNFEDVWTKLYKGNTYHLNAERIDEITDHYNFTLKFIAVCHECFIRVNLRLTKEGKFVLVENLGQVNTTHQINQEELEAFFSAN